MSTSVKSIYTLLSPAVDTAVNTLSGTMNALNAGDLQINEIMAVQAESAQASQVVSFASKSIDMVRKMGEKVIDNTNS
jgi:hypothetical protein